MAIYRDEAKILWTRKNDENNHQRITLEAHNDFQVALHNLSDGGATLFSQEQFYEMVEAGAKHFGKQVTFEDLSIYCPVCQALSRSVSTGNFYYRRCDSCGFNSPLVNTPEKADRFFASLTIPQPLIDALEPDRHEL